MFKCYVFSAHWCGPCRVLHKNLENFTDCEVVNYDVDEADEDLLIKYGVRNVPTTIIVDEDGNEQHRFIGLFKVSDLENKLDELTNN